MHSVLLWRGCVEKLHSLKMGGNFGNELPMHATATQQQQQPPAQIIVQYVHKCPECGSHAEPKPGEAMNEHLAARGDLQPQGLSAAHFTHQH